MEIQKKIEQGRQTMIITVGDSITWGRTYCADDETYTAKFAQLVARKYPDLGVIRYDGTYPKENGPIESYGKRILVQAGAEKQTVTVVRSGVGGDTVSRALRRIDDFTGYVVDNRRPDLLILMFGVNDALAADPDKFVSAEQFAENYRELLNQLDKKADGAEFVLMTPTYNDSGDTRFSCLDPYVQKVKEIAEERHCLLIDLHAMWMEHLQVGSAHYGQRDWLGAADGDSTHPTPLAAERMAQKIIQAIFEYK